MSQDAGLQFDHAHYHQVLRMARLADAHRIAGVFQRFHPFPLDDADALQIAQTLVGGLNAYLCDDDWFVDLYTQSSAELGLAFDLDPCFPSVRASLLRCEEGARRAAWDAVDAIAALRRRAGGETPQAHQSRAERFLECTSSTAIADTSSSFERLLAVAKTINPGKAAAFDGYAVQLTVAHCQRRIQPFAPQSAGRELFAFLMLAHFTFGWGMLQNPILERLLEAQAEPGLRDAAAWFGGIRQFAVQLMRSPTLSTRT